MISLADFQPLSIAKIDIFQQQPRFYSQIHCMHSVKVHASEEVTICWYVALRRQFLYVDSQVS